MNKMADDMTSPLLLAAASGHNEIVKLLLQKGAKINHMDIVTEFVVQIYFYHFQLFNFRWEIRH